MTVPEAHQTRDFEPQSLRFVAEHLADFPSAPEWVTSSGSLAAQEIRSILDVGCGPGTYLASLVDAFHPNQAVGLEPSDEAVQLLSDSYPEYSNMSFQQGFAHALPFDTDAFDLVVCWSVLHWVGRNEYLQALGELVRVTRKNLLVMDFVAESDYRVPYAHSEGMYTYKQDFVPAVLSSGIMTIVEDHRWWDGNEPGGVALLTSEDLQPFVGNSLNYVSRRGTLFAKRYDSLPELGPDDFGLPVNGPSPR